jgi:hypothetical protein
MNLSHKHHMSPIFVSPSIPKEILVAKPTLPETKVKKMSTATNIRPCNLALREQDSLPISKQAVHLSDPYPWLFARHCLRCYGVFLAQFDRSFPEMFDTVMATGSREALPICAMIRRQGFCDLVRGGRDETWISVATYRSIALGLAVSRGRLPPDRFADLAGRIERVMFRAFPCMVG